MRGIDYPFRWLQWIGKYPAVLFLVWATWLCLFNFMLGPNSYVRIHDEGDCPLPLRIGLGILFHRGHLDYWDPEVVSGVNIKAILSVFQFDVWPFLLFPDWIAYAFVKWSMRFLAGYFTFRLMSESLKTGTVPATYSGLAYAFFFQPSANNGWDGFALGTGPALAGLPLLLWMLGRLDDQKLGSACFAALIGICYSASAGYLLLGFAIFLVCFWFCFATPKSRGGFAFVVLPFVVAAVATAAPSMWAATVNAPFSQRVGAYLADCWALDVSQKIMGNANFALSLMGDNVVPLVVTIIALVWVRMSDRRLLYLVVGTVLCLLYQVLDVLVRLILGQYMGFLTGFHFTYVWHLVPFLAIVSGGLALQHVMLTANSDDNRGGFSNLLFGRRSLILLATFGILLAESLYVQARVAHLTITGPNFADCFRNPALVRLSQTAGGSPPFRVATVAQYARPEQHPAFAWAYGLETADGYINLYPKRYKEFWGKVIEKALDIEQTPIFGFSPRDYFTCWGSRVYLFSPYYSVRPPKQFTAGPECFSFEDYFSLRLLSLANVKFIISPFRLMGDGLQPYYEKEAEPGYLAEHRVARLKRFLSGKPFPAPLFIYENLRVLPRFFLVGRARILDRKEDVLDALQTAEYAELRSTSYVWRDDVRDINLGGLRADSSDVRIQSMESDRIVLHTKATAASVLIAANSYSPYWRAFVNGKPSMIFPVDHAFQGIYLNPGESEVELQYASSLRTFTTRKSLASNSPMLDLIGLTDLKITSSQHVGVVRNLHQGLLMRGGKNGHAPLAVPLKDLSHNSRINKAYSGLMKMAFGDETRFATAREKWEEPNALANIVALLNGEDYNPRIANYAHFYGLENWVPKEPDHVLTISLGQHPPSTWEIVRLKALELLNDGEFDSEVCGLVRVTARSLSRH